MLCVIAKLDNASTDRLASLQKATCSGMGEKPVYGHITVASYTGEDEAGFIQSCKEILKGFPAFHIAYERIEVLEKTSIIAAIPNKSETLYSLHNAIAEKHKGVLDKWTGTDSWYPHTTLVYYPHSHLLRIFIKLTELFRPFTATVSRIEFSRVNDDGYEIIDHVNL